MKFQVSDSQILSHRAREWGDRYLWQSETFGFIPHRAITRQEKKKFTTCLICRANRPQSRGGNDIGRRRRKNFFGRWESQTRKKKIPFKSVISSVCHRPLSSAFLLFQMSGRWLLLITDKRSTMANNNCNNIRSTVGARKVKMCSIKCCSNTIINNLLLHQQQQLQQHQYAQLYQQQQQFPPSPGSPAINKGSPQQPLIDPKSPNNRSPSVEKNIKPNLNSPIAQPKSNNNLVNPGNLVKSIPSPSSEKWRNSFEQQPVGESLRERVWLLRGV